VDALIVCGGVLLTILIIYLTVGRATGRQWGAIKLRNSGRGVPAEAVVVETKDTGTLLNNRPEIKFVLEVRPEKLAPYRAELFQDVDFSSMHKCKPGTVVRVIYDPEDPNVVALVEF
jgi:hypothetical protein